MLFCELNRKLTLELCYDEDFVGQLINNNEINMLSVPRCSLHDIERTTQ